MTNGWKVKEVIVHPVGGMQLSAGVIRMDDSRHFVGNLPGMAVSTGDSIDDVLQCMEQFAQRYYGDDVIVELTHSA